MCERITISRSAKAGQPRTHSLIPGMGTTIFPSPNGPKWLWNPY